MIQIKKNKLFLIARPDRAGVNDRSSPAKSVRVSWLSIQDYGLAPSESLPVSCLSDVPHFWTPPSDTNTRSSPIFCASRDIQYVEIDTCLAHQTKTATLRVAVIVCFYW
ncbi:MAG: hypothetical protein H7833_18630 [Magnetococcus sp. DMHC-1]